MANDLAETGRDPARDAWVARVLGIELAGPPARSSTGPAEDVRAMWREAKEATDDALNALAAELRSFEDPDLERIADFGLFGIGKTENVSLNKALIEFATAAPDGRPVAAAKLRAAVAAYRTIIEGGLVEEIDNNPFGVRVGVRDRLGRALTQIERVAA